MLTLLLLHLIRLLLPIACLTRRTMALPWLGKIYLLRGAERQSAVTETIRIARMLKLDIMSPLKF